MGKVLDKGKGGGVQEVREEKGVGAMRGREKEKSEVPPPENEATGPGSAGRMNGMQSLAKETGAEKPGDGLDRRMRECIALLRAKKPKVKRRTDGAMAASGAAFRASLLYRRLGKLPPERLAGFLKMEMVPAGQGGEAAEIIKMLEKGGIPPEKYLAKALRASPDLYDIIMRACDNCVFNVRPLKPARGDAKTEDTDFVKIYTELRKEGRFSNDAFVRNLMEQRIPVGNAGSALKLLEWLEGRESSPAPFDDGLKSAFANAFKKTIGRAGDGLELVSPTVLCDVESDKLEKDLAEKCITAAKLGRFDIRVLYFNLLEEKIPIREAKHAKLFMDALHCSFKEGFVSLRFNSKSPELTAAILRAIFKTPKGREETIE